MQPWVFRSLSRQFWSGWTRIKRQRKARRRRQSQGSDGPLAASLEVLYCALVGFCLFSCGERTQVPPLARLRIFLARVKTELARAQLSNHLGPPGRVRVLSCSRP